MNKTEFKKRMQSLKSYREQNPDKGYWDWRMSLPDYLPYTNDLEYDMRGAYESGAQPELADDGLYHLPTRHSKTGKILKASTHPTYWKGLTIDSELGYKPYFMGNNTYTWNDEDGPFIPWQKVEQFEEGGEKDPRKEYVSSSYQDRYPNILEKLQPYSNIKVRDKSSLLLSQFSKADSIIYTPILDRVEKYLQNNDITTDQEKQNARIVATGIPEIVLGSSALNKGKEWTGLSEGQELINSKVRKLTDNDIKKIFNADVLHIGPKEAVKLIPKGLNVIDMVKVGKYVNSDRFRNDYPAATLYADRLRRNSYEQGGEVPPSNYRGSNKPVNVNPFTKKPLANGAITPVLDLEGAANLTPIGDVLSIRDAYIAARNRDLLGLGLAGLGILPFMSRIRPIDRPPIPTVNRDAIQRQIDLSVSQTDKNKKVLDDFYNQRNGVYESLIENEDAFRRAARADRRSGTSYMQTYQGMVREYGRDGSNLNPNLAQPGYDRSLYEQPVKAQVSTSNPDLIRLNPRYKDPEELDETFQSLNPGLIRHEMGHSTDIKSGLDYTRSLADPSKFEPESRIKEMYPKSYKTIQDYLLNGSEIKSHMNEFRDFLFNKGEYQPKETINSIRKKLDKYGSRFKNLNILFDLYKNKRQFVNDYNLIPITATENNDNLV